MNDELRNGLRIRCSSDVNFKIKGISIEFGKWLRKKYKFPNRVVIYIRNSYIYKTKQNSEFTASFFAPYNRESGSFIRIKVGQYKLQDDMEENSEMLMLVLESIAHEITHYQQWIINKSFSEKKADRNSIKLVEQFLKYRVYNINISEKIAKILYRADEYSSDGNFTKAIEEYMNAINLGAYDDKIYNDIAYCYDLQEKYDESILYYDKCIHINSQNYDAYCNKGYALHCLSRYIEAIELFNKSLEIEPENQDAIIFKGDSLRALGHYKEAIECYNSVLALNPNYDLVYNYKGEVMYETGRYDEAKYCFEKALSIDPQNAEAFYNIAILFVKVNKKDDAIKYLERAIKINNNYKNCAIKQKEFMDMLDSDNFTRIIRLT